MKFKSLAPWRRGRGEREAESLRGMAEPLERLFERPWEMLGIKSGLSPEIEVEEKPSEIVVTAKLPGLSREDVTIDVTENTLSIRGEKSRSEEQRKHGTVRRREEVRSFARRFSLPSAVKAGEASASFKDGRLEIRLPRVKETQVRRIEIA